MPELSALLISDTHGTHRRDSYESLPSCDVLIHAGDFTNLGKPAEVEDYLAWLEQLDQFSDIVYIAGNHDLGYDAPPLTRLGNGTRLHYLYNRSVTIGGVNFYGSPYTPRFFDWAFMYDPADAKAIWSGIPTDTDVLITHGPPYGVLDQCPDRQGVMTSVGCPGLLAAVEERPSIQLHVFGHIHEGYGQIEHRNGRISVNASAIYGRQQQTPVEFTIST
jgi:Icc-related predicted phosphoesterase